VAAVDLSSERLDGTAKLAAAGDRLSTHVQNVTDTDAVNALPQAVIDAHGQVDGVLNVAGIIQKFEPFIELETADIERVLQVNFWGVVDMVRDFLPHLLRRPEAALVNVSSMGAFIPVPGQTVYGASKAAVKLLTEGLHAELGDTPVRVTVVFPGAWPPASPRTAASRHRPSRAPTTTPRTPRCCRRPKPPRSSSRACRRAPIGCLSAAMPR
jgi:NAD(P)-dependent dehydrogenase (short-subunit alcohol dehydrogenase family)